MPMLLKNQKRLGEELSMNKLTVRGGGRLEWPPGDVTLIRTFKLPFSAIPGTAITRPYTSLYPAANQNPIIHHVS
jgi:hypothetical protein